MKGLLLELRYPGATSCILIGGASGLKEADFGTFASVLWYAAEAQPGPAGARAGSVDYERVAGASAEDVARKVDAFVARDPLHLPCLFVTEAALSRDANAHEVVLRQVHASLEAHHRARVTRQKDGFRWQKNLLANLPAYSARALPASWKGALAGVPAFVCGAGPSLDVSARRLAEDSGRAVVIAADSSLRALERQGISPDFAVSIDVSKVPERCLPAGAPPGRVVLSPVSPPEWTSAMPGERICFVSNRQVTLDWLEGLGIPGSAFRATESCGSTGLELARFLGCAPIYLFGMDLALGATPAQARVSGADPELYKGSGFDPALQMPRVPANYGGEVQTHIYGDLTALNERLAGWPAGLVHNVNDRGARLSNTTLVHPDRFTTHVGAGVKGPLLARLADPEPASARAVASALGEVARLGQAGCEAIPGIRKALRERGPGGAAAELRTLFSRGEFARAMGGFSMKLLPHLAHPGEGSAEFWGGIVDEAEELSLLAARVAPPT